MPKKGNRKRLKFRPGDVCSESVTVADFANADPAVVKSGRVKKAVANAVEKEVKLLCGLEASQGPVQEVLSSVASVAPDDLESSDDFDREEGENEDRAARKKKNKRRKESSESGEEVHYPVDIWLLLASYLRPEDVCRFALICRSSWTVTCTAAFWTRLYRRHYRLEADLPPLLRPASVSGMRCLRVRVIRSLFHLYEPFSLRVAQDPALPEATPTTLLNSKCLLCWDNKVVGSRAEPVWEFNFKFIKQARCKNGGARALLMPRQYEDVHANPDSDCYLLKVTTLNFLRLNPAVMGMTLHLFTINVSTDMRHHRVRLLFQDAPLQRGGRRRGGSRGAPRWCWTPCTA